MPQENEHEASRRLKTEFMTQVDGAATTAGDRLLISKLYVLLVVFSRFCLRDPVYSTNNSTTNGPKLII